MSDYPTPPPTVPVLHPLSDARRPPPSRFPTWLQYAWMFVLVGFFGFGVLTGAKGFELTTRQPPGETMEGVLQREVEMLQRERGRILADAHFTHQRLDDVELREYFANQLLDEARAELRKLRSAWPGDEPPAPARSRVIPACAAYVLLDWAATQALYQQCRDAMYSRSDDELTARYANQARFEPLKRDQPHRVWLYLSPGEVGDYPEWLHNPRTEETLMRLCDYREAPMSTQDPNLRCPCE